MCGRRSSASRLDFTCQFEYRRVQRIKAKNNAAKTNGYPCQTESQRCGIRPAISYQHPKSRDNHRRRRCHPGHHMRNHRTGNKRKRRRKVAVHPRKRRNRKDIEQDESGCKRHSNERQHQINGVNSLFLRCCIGFHAKPPTILRNRRVCLNHTHRQR